jgi:hypothetical protein
MNTEEFQKATEGDLRLKCNQCFEKLKDSGSQEWPALLLSARFYMDEIERREHDRVAKRDLILELVVILLIGLELYFGITGGNAQLEMLQKLDTSAGQTAAAIATLAEEQKAALAAIQRLDESMQDHNVHSATAKKLPTIKERQHNDQ